MSKLEDRLREAFRADAGLVRPESIPPAPPVPPRPGRPARGRPGPRRARVLIPLAAAAAIIAIAVGVSLATPLFRGSSAPRTVPSVPAPHTRPVPAPTLAGDASTGVPASAPAPGLPRFYVTVYYAPAGGVNYIVVRDATTGQALARINPPAGQVFAMLAAPAGDRTFVTALGPGSGCSAQLQEFRLNAQGQPGPLVPLHITLPGISNTYGDLAITPDGRTIGYASYLCDGQGEVGVIHLATRQVRVWSVNETPPSLYNRPMALSLSADGGLLGYASFDGTSMLNTTAPAGSLSARSRLVSRSAIWEAVSGDGKALYGCSISPYRSGRPLPDVGTLTYSRIPLTGGPDHVIASWTGVRGPQCYASLDPAGNYLLVQYPTIAHGAIDWSRPAILDLRTGRLTDVNAPAFYGPLDIAW